MWKSGQWWVYCMVCGDKMLAERSMKRWDGLIVDQRCWEPRHPLDFMRGRKESIAVPFTSPEPGEVDVSPTYINLPAGDFCTPLSSSAVPGYSMPGCMQPKKAM